MQPVDSRHILFVLGMHRSGTSALCAALHACGASFGSGLLDAMRGVNDEGFWEAADVVALNDQLLAQVGVSWYSVTSAQLPFDWAAPAFEAARDEARKIMRRGFGAGPLEAIKDPRLCITLPFWVAVCDELGLRSSVCVISRAPMDVGRSLEQRDGFPLGYGLRLLQTYWLGIRDNVPEDALHVTYNGLLDDPVGLMGRLADALPLTLGPQRLESAVQGELRHHGAGQVQGLSPPLECGTIEFETLGSEVAAAFPVERTLSELAAALVHRGQELTRVGDAHALALETIAARDEQIEEIEQQLARIGSLHSLALATIEERDAQIRELGTLHSHALAVVEERDAQVRELEGRLEEIGSLHGHALATIEKRDNQITASDRRLEEIGSLHTHAMEVIKHKDEHLQRVLDKPGIGLLFRAMWKHETR